MEREGEGEEGVRMVRMGGGREGEESSASYFNMSPGII